MLVCFFECVSFVLLCSINLQWQCEPGPSQTYRQYRPHLWCRGCSKRWVIFLTHTHTHTHTHTPNQFLISFPSLTVRVVLTASLKGRKPNVSLIYFLFHTSYRTFQAVMWPQFLCVPLQMPMRRQRCCASSITWPRLKWRSKKSTVSFSSMWGLYSEQTGCALPLWCFSLHFVLCFSADKLSQYVLM